MLYCWRSDILVATFRRGGIDLEWIVDAGVADLVAAVGGTGVDVAAVARGAARAAGLRSEIAEQLSGGSDEPQQ